MSNNDDWAKLWANLISKYPLESAAVRQIHEKMTEIHRDVVTNPEINPEKWKEIRFFITKKPEGHDYTIVANQDGIVFLAALASVLAKGTMEIISSVLASEEFSTVLEERARAAAKEQLSHIMKQIPAQDFKHCPKCKYENDGNSNYCKNCGRKLS